jgi:hypothetical protein
VTTARSFLAAALGVAALIGSPSNATAQKFKLPAGLNDLNS